jgi:protease-4
MAILSMLNAMNQADPDVLVDRRRLKRHLSFWRVAAIVAAVGVVAVALDPASLVRRGTHVARLAVEGIIIDDPARTSTIAEAAKDRDVAALIVRIDSPGGTVVGGETLFRDLRLFAERKPVVAVMGEVAASGGYMAALGADHILARQGTITGSIGVILQTTDVTGLLDKLGVTTEAIKSAPLKAVPSPLEPLTESGRQATRSLVLDMYDMFVGMVAERRSLDRAKALELADGRVFTGRQARDLGLIDAIGGEREAREWLSQKGVPLALPLRDLKIVRPDDGWRDLISDALSLVTGKTYLAERLTLDGLIAVWHPDLRSR